MSQPAPIVMIVFNRPEHTARVVDALARNAEAAQSLLYVFSDAPRNADEAEAVEAVRSVFRNRTGFKQIIVHEHTENQGCSKNVLGSVSHVVNLHERCIVVEDDVMVSPLYLKYMNTALDLYEGDERMFCIGAYHPDFRMPESYREETFLMNRFCSWGWATWKAAWNKIDVDPLCIHEGMADRSIRKSFSVTGVDLLRTFRKVPEIWDLRVSYGMWKEGLRGLFPVENLIVNIGQDGSGINYNGTARNRYDEVRFPEKLPLLHRLDVVDQAVVKAHWKSTRKPVWRTVAITLAKGLGCYDLLVKKFGK